MHSWRYIASSHWHLQQSFAGLETYARQNRLLLAGLREEAMATEDFPSALAMSTPSSLGALAGVARFPLCKHRAGWGGVVPELTLTLWTLPGEGPEQIENPCLEAAYRNQHWGGRNLNFRDLCLLQRSSRHCWSMGCWTKEAALGPAFSDCLYKHSSFCFDLGPAPVQTVPRSHWCLISQVVLHSWLAVVSASQALFIPRYLPQQNSLPLCWSSLLLPTSALPSQDGSQ